MKDFAQRPTILIVEDIDWIRSGMRKAVEGQGYRTIEATNDAEALDLAEQESIALILTEEELPTFNALMMRLSEHSSLSNVSVAIVNPDAADGARLGNAYLLADFADIRSLLAVLRH
ncbi:MAG: response regulator [Acidobacteria bacterium]|nr:response regulator [Acidobacteriota bacterium]